MINGVVINRRTCLQGMGASLALPLLEVMGSAETVEGKSYKPPVRLGFMYMPHGVIMDQFWPADAESFLSSPPPALESLRPVLGQSPPKSIHAMCSIACSTSRNNNSAAAVPAR